MARPERFVGVETRRVEEISPAGYPRRGPAYQAYLILYLAFVLAPILAGLDIALRTSGCPLGALALARLSSLFEWTQKARQAA